MYASRIGWLLMLALISAAPAADGNRLAYLDGNDPYYPHRNFAKLTTPQWVGEDGVEAVVVLAIDDMRGPDKWEAYLRPILQRLQKIDGRAPVSIMTCNVDPKHPHLQKWLKEGLSLETHTIDHPCPILRDGDLAKAKSTYDRCVDLMNNVPNSKPVAFRTPCCDSLNTFSPRLISEIFNKTTPKGNFLTIDSSVFNVMTANDPSLPRELVLEKDGTSRFAKYLPRDRAFVNTIEDYPYPYVIGRTCWEFPCAVPSDWAAQHFHGVNNPKTVEDWKAYLDAVVIKQGVFCLVFHPHGWIRNEQVLDLIDYAEKKYGKKVKFLNFRECQERLNKNLLGGVPLRDPKAGRDNGARVMDLNNDGHSDVVIGNDKVVQSRLWSPTKKAWSSGKFPTRLVYTISIKGEEYTGLDGGVRFGIIRPDGYASFLFRLQGGNAEGAWEFDGQGWVENKNLLRGLVRRDGTAVRTTDILTLETGDTGVRLLDLDRDGRCELIIDESWGADVLSWSLEKKTWQTLPFLVPFGATVVDDRGADGGLRFVDIDGDGQLDIVYSNEKEYGVYLFKDMKEGWSRKVMAGKRSDDNAIPMISRNGTDNGFFVHSRSLWWQNETTAHLKDHVARLSFNDILKNEMPEGKSPEASLKALRARPGFAVEQVVAEPLVQDPIAFAIGPDGKLWVVEMGDYPLGVDGKGKFGGRVKFLESTKGDGKYDKATVFLDGLGFPTGVLPWRKGVLITCAPDILYAEDTDGDGKADKREVLFTGFTPGNQQHRVNTLAWGLDNWLHVANGDSGGIVKSLKTGKTLLLQGRDLRIRPDDGGMEVEGVQSQFGRCRDDWGNWFGCNNANPMWHLPFPDHYLARNGNVIPPAVKVNVSVTPGQSQVFPISRTLPRFNDFKNVNKFTSACSVMVYRDDLFGPAFANNTFVSEPVHNLVHREMMHAKGVTFTSWRAGDEQTSEFLASSDNWFRPTTIATGPDGALWVADMYRAVIEHPQWIPADWQKRLDLRAGHDKGRIYRVFPVGVKPREIPRLDKLDTAGLVAALESPNGWQRDTAQMMLLWKADKAAVPFLEKLYIDSKLPLARLHALCALDGMNALKTETVEFALHDSHAGVRRHAVRLAEGHPTPELLRRVKDDDVRVRYQLAFTLGEWDHELAASSLAKIAIRDKDDPYVVAALMTSVNKKNLDDVLKWILLFSEKDPPPAALVDRLLQTAAALGNNNATVTLLDALSRQQEQGKFQPWQLAALAGFLDSLDQRGSSLADLEKKGEGDLKAAVARLDDLFALARKDSSDPSASLEDRRLAIALLGRGRDRQRADIEALAGMLVPQAPEQLQLAAVTSLGRLNQTPALLLRGWKSYSPAVRSQVLDVLLRREETVKTLLVAIDKKDILPFEIDAARRQRLLQHKTADIRTRAEKLFALSITTDRQKVIDAFADVRKLQGDVPRGQTVFTKTCAACHKVGTLGKEIGPDLAALTDKSTDALLVAVLDPNRAIEARYVNYHAELKNGQTLAGMLLTETSTSITLIGPEGKEQVVLRSNLESLTSTGKSAMPEGIEKDLKPQDLSDLFSFLRSNKPALAVMRFPANKPAVVRPGADGAFQLSPTTCSIYGPSLVLEKQYGNLGFWSSPDDRAEWEIEVAKTGNFDVVLDYACVLDSAGNTLLLLTDEGRLSFKVDATASWDKYSLVRIGKLTLKAGKQTLTARCEGPIKGALIDLRTIRLVPAR